MGVFAQGDQEKDLGFEEISFLMDREAKETLAETPHCIIYGIIHDFQVGICVPASNRLQRHRKRLQAAGCRRLSMNLCVKPSMVGGMFLSEEQSGLQHC